MDDLISRKAIRDGMMKYGFHAPDMTVHEFVENELPSVPAVPLDKLCEWLSEKCRMTIGGLHCRFPKETWKQILNEWMEGQHET